jgi:2-polyprenyl-3-methyl-5-hydroxy-6-metoxy-1,4-benzoquinol methylase
MSKKNGLIESYYSLGQEENRLFTGPMQLEKTRTEDILRRFLPKPPATIVDVGGGAGVYALPLACQGYAVHLIDLVPLHIEQAKKSRRTAKKASPAILYGW